MTDFIRTLCDKGRREIWRAYIGCYKDQFFLYTKDPEAEKFLLKISRKAYYKEADKLIKFVLEREEMWSQIYNNLAQIEKERKAAEERAEIEKRRNNPNIVPGARGVFKHFSAKKEKIEYKEEKRFTLNEIRAFFVKLNECESLSPEVKNEMIFYGGTIPYLLCTSKAAETRKFGDIDIYLPEELMSRFRNELKKEISYIYDSLSLFYCSLYKGGRWGEHNRFAKRDYGFKAWLFGIKVSVFPLKDAVLDNGEIAVSSKSFRIGKDGDWSYLLDTVITREMYMKDIYKVVNISGTEVKVIRTEYTKASKRNAINYGRDSRQNTDLTDLHYINRHSKELNIDKKLVNFFMKNIPDFSVYKAYAIAYLRDGNWDTYGKVEMLDGSDYVIKVTRNKDESVNEGLS